MMTYLKAYLNIALLSLALMILSTACEKDRAKPSWNIDLLLPLLQDSLHIEEVLDEIFFVENPDQSISLVFNEELFTMNIDSMVKVPDTLLSFGLGLSFYPNPVTYQPGDTVVSQQFFFPLDLYSDTINDLLLEKLIIRQGDLLFQSYNKSNADLMVVLSIDEIWHPETGSFYSVQKVANNYPFEKGFDIADYHLDLRGPNGDTVNMLTYQVALIIHPDEPNEVTVSSEDSVALNVFFKDVILDYARGNFGHHRFGFGPETFAFNLFEDIDVKSLSFKEAEIKLQIENTYGLEVNFKVEEIQARNNETGEELSLESPLLETDLFVDRAMEDGEESGQISSHAAEFDFSNSNFPDLFSIQPNEFSYQLSLETNMNQDVNDQANFFYYDHPISIAVDAKVKGGLRVDSLFESSRLTWAGVDISKVEQGDLYLIFNNAFPFDFQMNLYLEDVDQQRIDTLIYQQFMAAGDLGDDSFVNAPQETRLSIPLNEDLKKHIKKAAYATYELVIYSANGQEVMLHQKDYLNFKLVGDFEYLIEQ